MLADNDESHPVHSRGVYVFQRRVQMSLTLLNIGTVKVCPMCRSTEIRRHRSPSSVVMDPEGRQSLSLPLGNFVGCAVGKLPVQR